MSDDAAREAAFARAYRMIRAAIDQTASPGQRLLVGDFTRITRLSPTPVREALSRLVGEGLIEEHRGGGYFVPRLDMRDVVEFYAMVRAVTSAAISERAAGQSIQRTRRLAAERTSPPEQVEGQVAYWLDHIAIISGNRLLATETRRLNARMAGVRRAEAALVTSMPAWLQEIGSLIETGDTSGQRQWLDRYCRSGQDKAEEIADWLSG
jgi:DNA-binding GntR family transcriptional regulator